MSENKNENKSPSSWKMCEVSTRLEYASKEVIEKGVDHSRIRDYAYILHDKDTNEDGELISPHWHVYMRFKNSVPTENICSWFGITPNCIEHIHGGWNNAMAYAIHANAPNKYQYLREEVHTNFDFDAAVAAANSKQIDKKRKQEIIDMITAGIIREYNYSDYISVEEYDRFKKSIENAFSYRRDKLEGSDRDMQVIYIHGDSGSGKTTYAKELALQNDYSYYISSGSNDLLDNYKGQDCLILDDIRPNYIDISDLLKLLDNHTNSTVRSRYKNKMLECKLVVITTAVSMEVFFRSLIGDTRESLVQLRRRCGLYVKMTKLTMNVSVWQPESERYMYVASYDNPIAGRFERHDRTIEEAREFVDNVFLFPSRTSDETILTAEGFRDADADESDLFVKQYELSLASD